MTPKKGSDRQYYFQAHQPAKKSKFLSLNGSNIISKADRKWLLIMYSTP